MRVRQVPGGDVRWEWGIIGGVDIFVQILMMLSVQNVHGNPQRRSMVFVVCFAAHFYLISPSPLVVLFDLTPPE